MKKGKKNEVDDSGISNPYNFAHNAHVTKDLNWEGKPEDIFEIEKQIGKGAYGAVYKAKFKLKDKDSKIYIAAKSIQLEEQEATDIKKEIDILKSCNHPSIVNYYGSMVVSSNHSKDAGKGKDQLKLPNDAGTHNLWILMDFCTAGSVKDLMTRTGKPLQEDQIAAILYSALKGLTYLHEKNIIHRDLKAANILLTSDGNAKIADFGISAKLDSEMTKAKTMIGTPYWMAPEVMVDQPYTNKIDIWSLGITAIEMAEMDPPNWDLKPFQLMLKLPKDPPPTLRNPKNFSAEFNEFLSLCLQKEPSQRLAAKQLISHSFIVNRLHKGLESLKSLVASAENASPKASTSPNSTHSEANLQTLVFKPKGDTSKQVTQRATITPNAVGVHKGTETIVSGQWTSETAGGCINHTSFRKNPQYYFHLNKDSKITIILQQDSSTNYHIGFYVAKTETGTRVLSLTAKELVEKAKFQNTPEVSISMNIGAGNYVIVPCTFAPANVGSFKLQVKSTESFELHLLEGAFAECSSEWNSETAGGCVNFSTWRKNPQFLLDVAQDTTVAVQLEAPELNFTNEADKPHIGFYVVKAQELAFKKVLLAPSDIVVDCKYTSKPSVSTKVSLKHSEGPFVIIPSTYTPGHNGKFAVAVSGKHMSLQHIPDNSWKYHAVKGEWKGKTAGGCKNFDTWVENPKFNLVVGGPTTIVVALSQSPKEQHHGIGFYVLENVESLKELTMKHDSTNKVIAKSKFVSGPEVALDVQIPAKGQYLVVPTTFQQGIEDKFDLIVFSKDDFALKVV